MPDVLMVKEILDKILYITLATVSSEGEPWISPVYTAFDTEYNFYWASTTYAQHTQNIKANSQVSAVIYDSTQPERTGRGVFLKGEATEINDPTLLQQIFPIFFGRINVPPREISYFQNQSPRRIYKFTPTQIWLSYYRQEGAYKVDGREEIDLAMLKNIKQNG
jgi:uncharacterized pyridoxamine 5'-phosphate oxidase family protein